MQEKDKKDFLNDMDRGEISLFSLDAFMLFFDDMVNSDDYEELLLPFVDARIFGANEVEKRISKFNGIFENLRKHQTYQEYKGNWPLYNPEQKAEVVSNIFQFFLQNKGIETHPKMKFGISFFQDDGESGGIAHLNHDELKAFVRLNSKMLYDYNVDFLSSIRSLAHESFHVYDFLLEEENIRLGRGQNYQDKLNRFLRHPEITGYHKNSGEIAPYWVGEMVSRELNNGQYEFPKPVFFTIEQDDDILQALDMVNNNKGEFKDILEKGYVKESEIPGVLSVAKQRPDLSNSNVKYTLDYPEPKM